MFCHYDVFGYIIIQNVDINCFRQMRKTIKNRLLIFSVCNAEWNWLLFKLLWNIVVYRIWNPGGARRCVRFRRSRLFLVQTIFL
jgi:hypothetical protein